MATWEKELEIAAAAARKAAQIALEMQAGIVAEPKDDGSPVTAADQKCEAFIATALHEAFPDDGLLGEEGTNVPSRNGRRWIIDPIDGTRDYVRGTPLWANLIGLEADGEVVAGVVNLPMLGELYTGSRGGGAFRNGDPIRVSNKTSFSEAVLCVNGLNRFSDIPFRERLLEALPSFWAVRSLGGAPDAMLVASGHADFWIEPKAAPWDLAPLKIVIEEAGGRFSDFQGRSTIYGGNCVAYAPGLEPEVRALMTEPRA
jgi:histidinol phosphatase-like enzyme (inositol monophosphatase family)